MYRVCIHTWLCNQTIIISKFPGSYVHVFIHMHKYATVSTV